MIAPASSADCSRLRADAEMPKYLRAAASAPQMPFTWTATQTYMQMTIRLGDVAANVPVDASRFARPR